MKKAIKGKHQFKPVTPQRWQHASFGKVSILVTVDQVVRGLIKLEDRLPEWRTPLAVSQVLLLRLETMRAEVKERAGRLTAALASGDQELARLEADAISQLVCTWRPHDPPGQALHGVKVTTDRRLYGIEEREES